jgi:hypothetical protein
MAAAAVAQVTAMADDHHGEKRYCDREHDDYHFWNDNEVERHEAYVPFVRVNRRHRQEYFSHEHGFNVEIR